MSTLSDAEASLDQQTKRARTSGAAAADADAPAQLLPPARRRGQGRAPILKPSTESLSALSSAPLSAVARAAPYLYPDESGSAAAGTDAAATTTVARLLPEAILSQFTVPVSVRAARVIAGELIQTQRALQAGAQQAALHARSEYCPVCDLPLPICVCSAVPDVSPLLPRVASVFVVTAPGEVAARRNSNTGKWLLRAGARRVLVGAAEEEDALAEALIRAPPGSVLVMFPDPASVTVGTFLDRLAGLAEGRARAAAAPATAESGSGSESVSENVYTRAYVSGLAADGTPLPTAAEASSTAAGTGTGVGAAAGGVLLPLPPVFAAVPTDIAAAATADTRQAGGAGVGAEAAVTVILLDGTWGAARTLLRRVHLQLRARGYDATHDIDDYTARTASLAAFTAAAAAVDPAAAIATGSTGPISSFAAATPSALRPLLLPTVRLTRSFRGDVGSLRKLGVDGHGSGAKSLTAVLQQQQQQQQAGAERESPGDHAGAGATAEAESVRAKVSTLHAFTVMIEELWGLSKQHTAHDAAAAAAATAGDDDTGVDTDADAAACAAAAAAGAVPAPASALAGTVVVPALSAASPASDSFTAVAERVIAAAATGRAAAHGVVEGLLSTLRAVVAAFHAHVGMTKNVLLPEEARGRSAALRAQLTEDISAKKAERKAAKTAARAAARAGSGAGAGAGAAMAERASVATAEASAAAEEASAAGEAAADTPQ
jgi:DTW domain-containing protein YfiP